MNITSIASQAGPGRNGAGAASVAVPAPASGPAPAQAGPPQPVAAPAQPPSQQADVQMAVARAQEVLSQTSANLKFAVDGDTGTLVVKVVDTETDQVIRQIPSEEMLALARNMDRLQGLLVKQEA